VEALPLLDQRIRELCAKAAKAKDEEVEPIFSELNALLREHAQFVREMAACTLNRGPKKHSKAA
jgi:hypothetical protein